MLDYLKYFLNPTHLFNVRPSAMTDRALIILAVIFCALIVVGVLAKLSAKKHRDVLKARGLNRFFNLGLTMGIIGLVYLFFAWQGVALLAARFWLLLWLIITVTWLIFVLKYLFVQAPKTRAEINKKKEFERYIP